MKGSGQFAVHKESQFSVFSQEFNEEPPYEYSFGVSSENSSGLPMITVQYYGCSGSASELEGDTYEYPAAMSVHTNEPQLRPTGSSLPARSSSQGRTTIHDELELPGQRMSRRRAGAGAATPRAE